MLTPNEAATKIGLSLSNDGTHLVASPEKVRIPITATGYAHAYQKVFNRISPYDGENNSAGEKLALERAGYIVTIVP